MTEPHQVEATTMAWRLAVTLLFVLLNGFFVAAEFALVKVRRSRVELLAQQGSKGAGVVCHILDHLDLYLSACQFGITVASLILGWLAEPAIAQLLIALAAKLGLAVGNGPMLHAVSLAIALTIVTALHMVLGEQAPKIWAIHHPEPTALFAAYPLRFFTLIFRPLIGVINWMANVLLRVAGIPSPGHNDASFTADELRAVLAESAQAGHISGRQQHFAENVLRFVNLEVRHILVPRVEVQELLATQTSEEVLNIIMTRGHSRYPLCEEDLDTTIGVVHAKDVLGALAADHDLDLRHLAREAVFVPDTQPIGRLIVELQRARTHVAVVIDEHGTALGLVFLEDALEEIVGTIRDEFDDEEPPVVEAGPGVIEMPGDLALPEAAEILGIELLGEDDTIGGYVVSLLKRLPEKGDELIVGPYRVEIADVSHHRILRLRFRRTDDDVTES